jgi:hypothetical protein
MLLSPLQWSPFHSRGSRELETHDACQSHLGPPPPRSCSAPSAFHLLVHSRLWFCAQIGTFWFRAMWSPQTGYLILSLSSLLVGRIATCPAPPDRKLEPTDATYWISAWKLAWVYRSGTRTYDERNASLPSVMRGPPTDLQDA